MWNPLNYDLISFAVLLLRRLEFRLVRLQRLEPPVKIAIKRELGDVISNSVDQLCWLLILEGEIVQTDRPLSVTVEILH
jgi:hypothetical protein